jgi:release factor glutamine methyltransferase
MSDADQSQKTWKVEDLVRWAAADFQKRGIDTPRLDAEILLAHAICCSRVELYLRFDRVPDRNQLDAFREAVKRRRNREPVAYITGKKAFHDIELAVAPGLFVPRPETELLVDEAVIALRELKEEEIRVLDLGAGTGAIALAIAKALPKVRAWAVDVDPRAVEMTKENAGSLGLDRRVIALEGDGFSPVTKLSPFDLIACNPPYVESADIDGLMPEVRDHEPARALDGGPDGLDFIRRLMEKAPSRLKPGGRLLVEVGEGQAGTVEAMAVGELVHESTRRDLQDIPRIVIFRKNL